MRIQCSAVPQPIPSSDSAILADRPALPFSRRDKVPRLQFRWVAASLTFQPVSSMLSRINSPKCGGFSKGSTRSLFGSFSENLFIGAFYGVDSMASPLRLLSDFPSLNRCTWFGEAVRVTSAFLKAFMNSVELGDGVRRPGIRPKVGEREIAEHLGGVHSARKTVSRLAREAQVLWAYAGVHLGTLEVATARN